MVDKPLPHLIFWLLLVACALVVGRYQLAIPSATGPARSRAAAPACPNTPYRSDKRSAGRSEPLTAHHPEQPDGGWLRWLCTRATCLPARAGMTRGSAPLC
ncbi:hypothetical protein PACG_05557 [Pseudomonas aeruginosa C3719]|uniref:Putative secreted protein n=1 Tax=Pseudomonas aeruginosa TaxID=287 RepID=Q58CI0_PSEAI|nr:hypothetical protein PACG_05557 [Pseudomonas aeruginosa C3719]CAH61034.1 putative secreted protein [Pseudomonas aeruginosa]